MNPTHRNLTTEPFGADSAQGLLPLEKAELVSRLPEKARLTCQSLLEELLRHAVLESKISPQPTES